MSYRSLARNHDFTVLWIGQTISQLGTAMSTFAFPLTAYAITGSTAAASLVTAAYFAGMLGVLLPAGVLADRIDRATVMRVSVGSGTIAYTALVLTSIGGILTQPLLIAIALLSGGATGLFTPAEASAVRTVVSTEDLPTALGQNQAREHIAALLGAPVGGLLYGALGWLPFAADALSYAACWLALGRLRTSLAPTGGRSAGTGGSAIRELTLGFRFIVAHPFLRLVGVWAPLTNLGLNAVFFLATLRLIATGFPAWQIGLVETAAGTSGILGALCAPWLIDRIPTGRLAIVMAWVFVPLLIPVALWNTPWVVGGALAVGIFVNPASNAAVGAYSQTILPPTMLGRFSSTTRFISMSTMPLAPLLAGALLAGIGGTRAVLALAVPVAAIALIPTLSRTMWRIGRPATWPRPADHHARSRPLGVA
ncbi:MAG: MFS transporter [Nocardioides sp.]|uniref:MFS transporter n=1 Tax=Nocardioides sp. TaxID=35761 RepID=UPI0039E4FD98